MFGKEAFAKVGKYFKALRFTCEGEGKHKLVGAASPLKLPSLLSLSLSKAWDNSPGRLAATLCIHGADYTSRCM